MSEITLAMLRDVWEDVRRRRYGPYSVLSPLEQAAALLHYVPGSGSVLTDATSGTCMTALAQCERLGGEAYAEGHGYWFEVAQIIRATHDHDFCERAESLARDHGSTDAAMDADGRSKHTRGPQR